MPTALATLLAAFLASQAQPPAAQEENPPELVWKLKPDDKFDMKWTYSDIRHQEQGTNDPVDSGDKREVEAELTPREPVGLAGNILVKIRKASWTVYNREYEIVVTFLEGKGATSKVNVKVKDDPKAGISRVALAKEQGESLASEMKKVFEGEYTINTLLRPGEAFMARNGGDVATTAAIFTKMYLHCKTPNGTVSAGQTWKDPLTRVDRSSGLIEVETIEYKVTNVSKTGMTVKAGFQLPINKASVANDQKTTGTFTYAREYTFSRDYYLASSKEESSLKKKVTAKVKFYEEDTSITTKQELTIKKRAAPKEK